MCRWPHSAQTDFSAMPAGKASFAAHPPYQQAGVKLELRMLRIRRAEETMINLKVAVRTTVLLVDDDIRQLDLLTLTMEMSGFSVVTARSPLEAISLMNEPSFRKIDVAVIDYRLPVMNGCVLAAYLKARYPELKVALYSGALGISEDERMSLDGLVSTSDDISALLSKITEFGQIDPASPTLFALEIDGFIEALN